ncbi:hypothetical protein MP228_010612 [Amoeboaphelidium protococcarum]|nr:hypothetical protein MP228_010612 [Amoeboaphelidium protococcarum]
MENYYSFDEFREDDTQSVQSSNAGAAKSVMTSIFKAIKNLSSLSVQNSQLESNNEHKYANADIVEQNSSSGSNVGERVVRDQQKLPEAAAKHFNQQAPNVNQVSGNRLVRPKKAIKNIIGKRLSGGVGQNNNDGVYDNDQKQFWIDDSYVNDCYSCHLPFNLLRRKHHCRVCGQVFCGNCLTTTEYQDQMTKICLYDLGMMERSMQKRLDMEQSQSSLTRTLRSGSFINERFTLDYTPQVEKAEDSTTSIHSIKRIINTTTQSIMNFNFWQPPIEVGEQSADQSHLPFRPDVDDALDSSPVAADIQTEDFGDLMINRSGTLSSNTLKFSATALRDQLYQMNFQAIDQSSRDHSHQLEGSSPVQNGLDINGLQSDYQSDQQQFQSQHTKQSSVSNKSVMKHKRSQTFNAQNLVDIDALSKDHLRKLLAQIMSQQRVGDESWISVLFDLCLQICHDAVLNVKGNSDDIDVTQYVQIKRILGSSPSQSQVLYGVVFNHNVMHKRMQKILSDPKIMLISFPIAYQRNDKQFQPLEPVIAQEKEQLRNMVNMIMLKKPDIVLCQRSVSRVALEYFVAYGNVSVACDVKRSVIERVSRATGAEIIESLDRLNVKTNTKLGQCGHFYIKTFRYTSPQSGKVYSKTCMFFDQIPVKNSCTILLRGTQKSALTKVKAVAKFFVYCMYSVKQESYLLRDCFSRRNQEAEQEIAYKDEAVARPSHDTELEVGDVQKLLLPFKDIILCPSATVIIGCPYLLQRLADYEEILLSSIDNEDSDPQGVYFQQLTQLKQIVALAVLSLSSGDSDEYKVPKGAPIVLKDGINYLTENSHVVLSPLTSQNLAILYCIVNTNTSLPCQQPGINFIDFYRESDMSLGQYLEELCFDQNYVCPNEQCQQSMLLHYRSYVHRDAKINVIVEKFQCPISGMENSILMWSYCRICQIVTPCVPLSDDSWNFSFGRYLELSFYDQGVYMRPDICVHSAFKDQIRYFGLGNLAVRFEYETVTLYEVQSSDRMLKFEEKQSLRFHQGKLQEFVESAVKDYFQSVQITINDLAIKKVNAKVEEFKADLDSLRQTVDKLQAQLSPNQLIHNLKSDQSFSSQLSDAKKQVYEACVQIDRRISSIARKYILQDSKDKRLAQMLAKQVSGEQSVPGSPVKVTSQDQQLNDTASEFASDLKLNTKNLGQISLLQSSSFANSPQSSQPSVLPSPVEVSTNDQDEALRLQEQQLARLSKKFGEGERSSIAKTLNDMWMVAQNAYGLTDVVKTLGGPESSLVFELAQLTIPRYPLDLNEHLMDKTDIIIKEQEPSSIIAYVLSSKHYQNEIERMRVAFQDTSSQSNVERSTMPSQSVASTSSATAPVDSTQSIPQQQQQQIARPLANALGLPEPGLNSSMSSISPGIDSNKIRDSEQSEEHMQAGHGKAQSAQQSSSDKKPENSFGHYLLHPSGTHIRYQFQAGSASCFCRVYYAEQFDAIRQFYNIGDDFVTSLSHCFLWKSNGGQSGSKFYKSFDERFIMKSLNKAETESLLRFAPSYFEYLYQVLFNDLPSVLVKMFGIYRIGYKNADTGKQIKMDVIVMENLFYQKNISKIFDLKGSVRNRHSVATGSENEVLLDENLIQIMAESPLFVRDHSKKILRASVWNDTLFLSKLNVMDYSLLVGVDSERQELVIGIVDFIRTFTWDKKLESWVKETGILGGGIGKVPTIISPRQYKLRFREAMEKYFLLVPDKYYQNLQQSTADTQL